MNLESEGILELRAWPVNYFVSNKCGPDASTEDRCNLPALMNFVETMWAQLFEHGNLLLYCKQGCNRSAAAAAAVISYGTGQAPDQVVAVNSMEPSYAPSSLAAQLHCGCRHRYVTW